MGKLEGKIALITGAIDIRDIAFNAD